jgi:hypothetical protein
VAVVSDRCLRGSPKIKKRLQLFFRPSCADVIMSHFYWNPVLPDGTLSDQKIPIWVNFWRSCNERRWYFYGHFVYFTSKWYILWPFGRFDGLFPVLVCFTEKNLATLSKPRATIISRRIFDTQRNLFWVDRSVSGWPDWESFAIRAIVCLGQLYLKIVNFEIFLWLLFTDKVVY